MFQTLRIPLGLGKRFPGIAASKLGIALLALLFIARPLQAQSEQGSILVFQECNTPVNLQDNYTFDATFSLGRRGMWAPIPGKGEGDETEAAPQTLPLYPLTTPGESVEASDSCRGSFSVLRRLVQLEASQLESEAEGNTSAEEPRESSTLTSRSYDLPDRNQSIYYKNKLEFSLEGGWLPINIPFPFDFLLGSGYNFPGLYYTLVPIIASVRWQINDVGGPRVLRGNWDVTFSGSVAVIPRGAETRYFSYMMGIRRNFVPRGWRLVPYLDGRVGLGNIDAKGPLGVEYAQGQNFTFTLSLGSGVRYNFSPQYAIQAGMNYMHISNLYLSQPKFLNYGINVYGPWVGIDVRFGKHRPAVQ